MKDKDKLSLEDISRLVEDKSSQARIEVADKLARQYSNNEFPKEQLYLAEQIFRLLVKDAETLVRKALTDNLKNVKSVPRDIILDLAKDVTEVSLPMLEYSEVLTEQDLVSIIKSTIEIARHIAISKRKDVSENVSEALIDTKNQYVVSSLLQNKTAHIDKDGFDKIISNFADNNRVIELMVAHDSITMEIAEKVMDKVSDAIREKLKQKHKGTLKNIDEGVFEKSRELASMKMMGPESSDQELMRLMNYIEQTGSIMQDLHRTDSKLALMVENLEVSGKLTPFTALCMGSFPLFEITMARLAKIPIFNVRKLINDDSEQGFIALYKKAGLPESMFEAVRIIVHVVREIDRDPNKHKMLQNPTQLGVYMSERIMSMAAHREIENLSYFVTMIQHHSRNFAQ